MNIPQLIDLARKNTESGTIAEVLSELEISSATLSQWRTGKTCPTPAHAARLAELAKVDAAPIVLAVLEHTTKEEALRRVLRRLKRSLHAALTAAPALLMAAHHCILCKIDQLRESPA